MAHAIEIRTRAVELLKEGYTQNNVAKILNVGTTSIKRWQNQIEEFGSIETYYDSSSRVSPKLPKDELTEYIRQNNDALLKEIATHFNCTPQRSFMLVSVTKLLIKKEPYYKEHDE